ncbi:MAG: TM2 domain-containing protein [Candidatus Woesearchaeota archaeon]
MVKKKSNQKSMKKSTVYVNVREVKWVLLLVMSIIFGWLGVDRFMMGKVGTGLLKLFTLGGLGAWWLIDLILIATKYNYKDVKYIE